MSQSGQYRTHGAHDLLEFATLKDVIELKYGGMLYAFLSDKILHNPEKIGRRTRHGSVPDVALLKDMVIVRVDILGRDGDSFFLDVIVSTTIEISDAQRPTVDSDKVGQWFRVRCDLTLTCKDSSCVARTVAIYRPHAVSKPSLSPYLVPNIGKDELDAVAEDFLARYYPEALESPCPVPAREVAERMGLHVRYARLTEDLSKMGQVFFVDTVVQVCSDMTGTTKEIEAQAGTILIDQDAYYLLKPASTNSTILHECVHWDMDRAFFYLQKLFFYDTSAFVRWMTNATRGASNWTLFDQIEKRTRNLIPRIQMSAVQTRRKAEEVMAKYNLGAKPGQMVSVISEMAEFYVVTWQVAKQRLVELGYPQAGEALPLGRRKTLGNLFAPSKENSPKTYEVSTQAALKEYIDNPAFRGVIDTGHFQYVEGRFCIRHERYITLSASGSTRMTEYAKTHLAECCLAFLVQSWSNTDADALQKSTLYRRAGATGPAYDQASERSIAETAQILAARANEIAMIMKKLPGGFGETLKVHMERQGVTGEELSVRSLVSSKQVQRMLNEDKYSGKLKAVIAVSIILKLDPQLTFDLIEKAGFKFSASKEHMFLKLMIESCSNSTIYECNRMLHSIGYKALTSNE